MKKIIFLIIIFCFTSNVYASNLEQLEVSEPINVYKLAERIEEEETTDEKNNYLQYFILIVAFIGVSALFLFLKDDGED